MVKRASRVPQPKRGMSVDVAITGLKETQKALTKIVEGLQGNILYSAVAKATLLVVGSARKNAPVDTGRLRASIVPEIRTRDSVVQGIVGSKIKYAPYQELGTRPFTPPKSALVRWAMRKERNNKKAANLLAGRAWMSIRRRGVIAKRFMQRAIEEHRENIKRIVYNAIQNIAKGK